jgi:GMP synthase-like glutamine amidotransferase
VAVKDAASTGARRYRGEVRALLIANALDADAGFIGERFRHHGFSFTECHRERPSEWPSLDSCELVLMLGSDWSVYWEHVAEQVAAEVSLVHRAHEDGRPVFGICFGAQILATALGGKVERAPEPEVGWYDVDSEEPAIATGPWMQWHYDRVVVPPGAVLAQSPRAVQAFRANRSFATQFHPEVDESIIERWLRLGGAAEFERLELSVDELRSTTRANVASSRPAADTLVDWFLATV